MNGIKIQIGKIFMNRTRKYLFPLVKQYGSDFTFRINSLFKVAMGIGDIVAEKCGFVHEKHLFILVDSKYEPHIFRKTLEMLRQHPAYEDDYVFGNISNSRFHMIVIKIPEEYLPTLQMFKESKFSKMYSEQDIRKLFNFEKRKGTDRKLYESAYRVLIHDHNYKIEFAQQLRDEFDIPDISVTDIADDKEYDLPIKKIEEVFNMKGV